MHHCASFVKCRRYLRLVCACTHCEFCLGAGQKEEVGLLFRSFFVLYNSLFFYVPSCCFYVLCSGFEWHLEKASTIFFSLASEEVDGRDSYQTAV